MSIVILYIIDPGKELVNVKLDIIITVLALLAKLVIIVV